MSEPHFNELSPAAAEALAFLLEELGEAQQVIGKILRHGLTSHHPTTHERNDAALARELGDIRAAMVIVTRLGIVVEADVYQRTTEKLDRVGAWLHHIECNADWTAAK